MYRLIAFFLFLSGCMGQITLNGTCNFTNISAERNLNVTQLSGDWYQIKRINNLQECGTCSTMTINATLMNNALPKVTISNKEVSNKKLLHKSGNITLDDRVQGKFSMKLPNIAYDSIILVTNYTNYALLYSCNNINDYTKNVWAWVLSRNTTLTKDQNDLIQTIINNNEELKNAAWTISDHSKKACERNASVSYKISPVLILVTVVIAYKDIFASKEL